jgi:broad specificity phosphatase PhoE
MRLYLLRHGETQWNRVHRVMGQTPVPLGEGGRDMVAQLADALKGESITVIYSSTVARAAESAAILAASWGAEIREEPHLNESRFERWVGKTYDELADDPDFRLYQTTPTRASFSEHEGITDVQSRALAAVERIVSEAKARDIQSVAAVSHSDVIKPILTYYLGMELDAMHRLGISVASASLIDLSRTPPRVRYVNVAPWKWR